MNSISRGYHVPLKRAKSTLHQYYSYIKFAPLLSTDVEMKSSQSQLSNGVSTTFSRDRSEECGLREDFGSRGGPLPPNKKNRIARFADRGAGIDPVHTSFLV